MSEWRKITSVIVKGTHMPDGCFECVCQGYERLYAGTAFESGYYKCNVTGESIEGMYHKRLTDCPLFELKTWEEI